MTKKIFKIIKYFFKSRIFSLKNNKIGIYKVIYLNYPTACVNPLDVISISGYPIFLQKHGNYNISP